MNLENLLSFDYHFCTVLFSTKYRLGLDWDFSSLIIQFVTSCFSGQSFEIISHIAVTFGLCKIDQNSSGTFAISVSANWTIAKISARRALPLWVHEGLSGILSIPECKTSTTKLTPYTNTISTPANSFHVDSFLSAMMTDCILYRFIYFRQPIEQ